MGLQEHIRKGVYLAEKFESFVRNDPRFEIPSKRYLGLVVFRLVGDNFITEALCKRLNSRGNIHCVPASLKGKYVIRFTVTSQRTTLEDIIKDWKEIVGVANEVLRERECYMRRTKVPLGETRDRNENFGSSLLLSNVPMSPKIVNGSFAAIYDQGDVLEQFKKTIRLRKNAQDSPAMRRRIKGILMSGKQFSLDSRLDLFHGIETTPTGKPSISEIANNLPVVEDSAEIEDKSSSPSEYDSSGLQSPIKENLDIPQSRHCRSKSVDHQTNLTINHFLEVKKKLCHKCGHKVNNPVEKPVN